jgi:PAS domain S-box-containing protein
LFQSIAEALPHIVWTATAEGDLDYANGRWFEYTGMTADETEIFGWEAVLHADDLGSAVAAWENSKQNGVRFESEHRLKRASDGLYRWHAARAVPFHDATGALTQWYGSHVDIHDQKSAIAYAERLASQSRLHEQEMSARKRAEAALRASSELFRQIEEHAPIGLALVSLEGMFMRVNPAMSALTGYTKDELLALGYAELMHPDDVHLIRSYVARTRESTGTNAGIETRLMHKDGYALWSSLTFSLVRDDAREDLYFIAQVQDVTPRKVAEAAKIAQEAALFAADVKSRFLATMSHELRTPMNGIIGLTELLSLTELSDAQREYVEIVLESGASLLRVLDDILDFSKADAGKLRLEIIDFDLPGQIRSLGALFAPRAKTKGIQLSMHVDPAVPAMVKGDPGRIRQILMNLIGNALKFTPADGSVKIFVATDASEATATTVRFTVIDSGPGIAPEVRDRLFVPFSQLDDSTTRKYGGTGLGLAICKQLVDLMGGEIGISSEPPSGSAFWFTLPLKCGVAIEPNIIQTPTYTGPDRRAQVRPRSEKLLLAEDNEVNALLASTWCSWIAKCRSCTASKRPG